MRQLRCSGWKGAVTCGVWIAITLAVVSAEAQEVGSTPETETVDVEELSRQVTVLAEEVERLRSGEAEVDVTPDQARALGLGSSAASVYRQSSGVSIAGYGEMLYENFADQIEAGAASGKGSQVDFLRAIIYFGYRFDDKFLFNSEIEVEHANEIGVEFAYIDYIAHPALTVRGGLLLVPMGLTNEFHEPTTFLSARRPEVESRIMPSTWRENGFGFVGSKGRFSYRAYVVNGLEAEGFTSDGFRGGRQKGSKAKVADPAFVGRLDVTPVPGVFVGGSIYRGDSNQDAFLLGGQPISLRTTIGELHAQAQVRGFDVRGLYSRAVLDNADQLNQSKGLTGASGVGEMLEGGYVQVGYNLLSQLRQSVAVTPFYRLELLDTQARVAPGGMKDPAMDRTYHTFGVAVNPIPNISVKADYQVARNKVQTGVNQFSVALGYNF